MSDVNSRAPWALPGEGAVSLPLVSRGVLRFHLSGWKLVHHPCQCMFRHLFFSTCMFPPSHSADKWERKFDKQFVLCQLHQITSRVCPSNHTKASQGPWGVKFQGLMRFLRQSENYRVDMRRLQQKESSFQPLTTTVLWLPESDLPPPISSHYLV